MAQSNEGRFSTNFSDTQKALILRSLLQIRRLARRRGLDTIKFEVAMYLAEGWFSQKRGSSIVHIADVTGIPKETTRRKINEMIAEGLVVRIASRNVRASDAFMVVLAEIAGQSGEIILSLARQLRSSDRSP